MAKQTRVPWEELSKVFRNPGHQAVLVYRFAHWLLTTNRTVRFILAPLKLMLQHRMKARWGIDIAQEARIGRGFRIIHFGGIFIGYQVVAGDDLYISHDVTLGEKGKRDRRGAPTIGNNVYIAPGAKIVGKIHIGNNVKIGPNAVVDRDIPDNALVQVRAPQIAVFPNYEE